MRIACLEHVAFEGPAAIEAWARARAHRLARVHLDRGDPLPALEELDWLVIMGGPMSVCDEARHPWLRDEKRLVAGAIAAGKTVLGVCLGAQLIAGVLGARVSRSAHREVGWFPVQRTDEGACARPFAAFPPELLVFHWHGETFELPAGAVPVARSPACEQQAFVLDERVVGLQFHLEMTPAAVRSLIEHCPADLAPGPFVEPSASMLADPGRFERATAALHGILDRLEP